MLYNLELLEKAGLDPTKLPDTWDDLIAAAKKMSNAAEGVWGLVLANQAGFASAQMYYTFLLTAGGELITPDGKTSPCTARKESAHTRGFAVQFSGAGSQAFPLALDAVLRRADEHFDQVIVQAIVELALKAPFKLRVIQVTRMKLEIVRMDGNVVPELDDHLHRLTLGTCIESKQRMLVQTQLSEDACQTWIVPIGHTCIVKAIEKSSVWTRVGCATSLTAAVIRPSLAGLMAAIVHLCAEWGRRIFSVLDCVFTTCYNLLSTTLFSRQNSGVCSGGRVKTPIGLSLMPWLITTSLILGCATASIAASVAVQKVQIAEGIYQFVTAPDGYVPNGNSVVIVNENDVLVFDTFTRPSTARTVLAEIRKITDKPVRYVVNSHHHPDHWSGNEVYAQAFPNLEIIASEESRRFMLNIAKAWPPVFTNNLRKDQADLDKEISTGKVSDGTPLTAEQRRKDEGELRLESEFVAEAMKVERTYPTLTYSDKLTLLHGGREFRFMSMVGDADGTTVLYLPNEKILVTGDVLSYPVPYVNSQVSQHAKTLRTLAQFDADVIIPGHGPAWHDKSFLNLEAELLESVVGQVVQAVQKGMVTVEEMQKVVNVEPLRVKFTHDDKDLNAKFQRYVNRMIENASREARDGRKFEY